jgi:hypothetical protein
MDEQLTTPSMVAREISEDQLSNPPRILDEHFDRWCDPYLVSRLPGFASLLQKNGSQDPLTCKSVSKVPKLDIRLILPSQHYFRNSSGLVEGIVPPDMDVSITMNLRIRSKSAFVWEQAG